MITTLGISVLVIILGYLLGSIPFAFIIAKFKGVDIRDRAIDGARGASLTWRKVGKIYGLLVAALDILKGLISVFIAQKFSGQPTVVILAGLAAIIGHNWSLYMKFTGGKGAATTGGSLVYILPEQFLISFLIILLPILFFLRTKKSFILPGFKKKFKTSNFFSGIFFGVMFIVSSATNHFSVYTFSSLIFSVPMFFKDRQIKKNNLKK
ncbi:MAG: glycerol-3-phosphate acyltransferase [Candidatus Pacebacteria bacterium]|nr:glycerol-3-phosphate acyltransferase [Candidatus Paceibacterota bacterium]